MAKKILYFTAGETATATELAEIAALNALTVPGYSVGVRNATKVNTVETCDLKAGSAPAAYAAIPAYGTIDAARPLKFDLWPATGTIAALATLQLVAIATTGASLDAVATAEITAEATVTYASSDETKATVSATGLVTGVAAGTTTITATYTYAVGKTITDTCVITVS